MKMYDYLKHLKQTYYGLTSVIFLAIATIKNNPYPILVGEVCIGKKWVKLSKTTDFQVLYLI